jgi:hypothetical protein
MLRSPNIFVRLARKAGTGDLRAQLELRRELEPELIHIVRSVICGGGEGETSVKRRILREAQRAGLSTGTAAQADGELRIRAVARSICAAIVEGVRSDRSGPEGLGDTVRV